MQTGFGVDGQDSVSAHAHSSEIFRSSVPKSERVGGAWVCESGPVQGGVNVEPDFTPARAAGTDHRRFSEQEKMQFLPYGF